MMNALLKALQSSDCVAVEARLERPARAAVTAAIPDGPGGGGGSLRALGHGLTATTDIWSHQARALQAIVAGKNLVIATGTASGKSLVFQLPILAALQTGSSRHLVFYPQKALAADQFKRWQAALLQVGLDPDLVREINGDVPSPAREAALATARILLVTPDVIHAWLMRQVSSPLVKAFLRELQFVVIDEAHALEGAFGTSTAYLLRRLMRARDATGPVCDLQFIAASATVRNPASHLEALTGQPFTSIDEVENGAPAAGCTLAHIAGPGHGAAAEAHLAALLSATIPQLGSNAFIAFADSRQGVERIARKIDRADVLPYRSGYEAADRRRIEAALRCGALKGVISTSALELGIDIPQFVLGVNLGLPQSRKALRQRIGRIGRTQPGLFLLVAPSPTFAQLGTSFADYVTGEVELCPLYLENEFIQYAQARCLLEEASTQGMADLASDDRWPASFCAMLDQARPGAKRSRELDILAAAGGDSPHLNFPLRQLCDQTLALRIRGFADPIGTISLAQAVREAYPGATYYHMQRGHKVSEWRVNSYERTIFLKPSKTAQPTQALLRNCVTGSYAADEVIASRLLRSQSGAVAEARLQVTESVEGYRTDKGSVSYSFLRQANPRMRRQSREFSTTGVIIQISESWFSGSRAEPVQRRLALGNALKELLCRDESVATSEIQVAASQVALRGAAGALKLDDAIAIYDDLHGGLRLTAKLYDLLPVLAQRLCLAAEAAGAEALVDGDTANRFAAWVRALQPVMPAHCGSIDVPEGEYLIYAPGSLVSFRKQGLQFERRLIGPELMAFPAGDMLFYQYECDDDATCWVAHDAVEPSGQEWSRVLWNPLTKALRTCP